MWKQTNPMSHQSIQFNGHLTRIGTRADGSLGLTLESGEFTAEDKLAVFSLQNIPCTVALVPNDADAAPPKVVKSELSKKTQSERIRSVLYIYWKQLGEPGDFPAFYESETNKYINAVKMRLKPE